MDLLDSRTRKPQPIEQVRPPKPPAYSVASPTVWADETPRMTHEQFAQVWDAILAALSYKDIAKGQLLLNRWRLELSQAWQWHEDIERIVKPLCPLAVTGDCEVWVAEEALRQNIFSQHELQRLNMSICFIMRRKPVS